MNAVEKLAIISEIHALKARYFNAMDCKDWAGLEGVFAPDLIADFREAAGAFDESQLTYGASRYVGALAKMLEHVTTVHHGHMPEIVIEAPNAARGVWAMEDKLWVQDGSKLPFRTMNGFGHYHERYVRLDAGWRIKEIRLSRLRVDIG